MRTIKQQGQVNNSQGRSSRRRQWEDDNPSCLYVPSRHLHKQSQLVRWWGREPILHPCPFVGIRLHPKPKRWVREMPSFGVNRDVEKRTMDFFSSYLNSRERRTQEKEVEIVVNFELKVGIEARFSNDELGKRFYYCKF